MRKLLWFTVGFTLACALCAYLYTVWLLAGIPIGLLCFVLAIIMRKRAKAFQVVAVIFLGLSMGIFWFSAYRYFYLSPATEADGSERILTAEIIDYSETTDYGTSVKAKVTVDGKTYRSVLYLQEQRELKPGDGVSSSFRLRMTHEGLEGNTYHRGSRIFLLAYAQSDEVYQIADQIPLRYFSAMIRRALTEKIELLFPHDTSFFAKALFLGDRSEVDYETNTAFKVSGISHIIAVSGLHVSILFSVIFVIAGRKRLLTVLIGVPVLVMFAAVTGFTPSVTRACVMQILYIISELVLREYDRPTSLSAAVLLMLICNPIAVTSVSLQLSVGCMIGIFFFSEKIHQWICGLSFWKDWKGKTLKFRLRNWFASGVSITFSAMFFTLPLVAFYFGCVSLVGVITNLLTLWAVSWIFYGIMLVCSMGFFWQQGASAIAWVISWLIRYVLTTSKILSSIPLAAVYTKSIFIVCWIIFCYVMVFAFLLWKKRRVLVLLSAILISLAISLLISWCLPLTAKSQVTILDVGQGQSIILQSNGKTFLVDCGGDDPREAADQAAETLLSMGIYRLDGLVLTHYDEDHAGGIPYLLSRIGADYVYLPMSSEEENSKQTILNAVGDAAVLIQQDTLLEWTESSLEIFAPMSQSSDNESGLSILFRGENCDILITGDLSISGENKLFLEKSIPQLTALVAGHHGSPESTGLGLLSVAKPQYVFISVGQDNPYGHPNQQVLERLAKYGCHVFRTDLDGTIVFRR